MYIILVIDKLKMVYLRFFELTINMGKVDQGKALPLMEEFYTIQGEGYHKGSAAYFIRIGGCDVGCHWWEKQIHD